MKNVTITLDEETAAGGVHAARSDTSVSRVVGEMLRRRRMRDARAYDAAMRRFLSRPARPLSGASQPFPARDEVD